ncbi:transcriptional repressor TCF25-domain-containing protein, partial [Mycena floridula]
PPMPPRLNKRQQRELEEIAALAGPSSGNDDDDDEEEHRAPAASGFAALIVSDDDKEAEDEDREDEKRQKPKKKKKKKAAASEAPPDSPVSHSGTPLTARSGTPSTTTPRPTIPPLVKNEKKAAKKAKAKAKKADKDDLDQALAELSMKYPDLQQNAAASSSSSSSSSFIQSLGSLLSVSLSHLDSEAEMRKFFGKNVVRSATQAGPSRISSSRRPNAVLRSNLTRPKASWMHVSQREGLSIRALTEDELAEQSQSHGWEQVLREEHWWTVEYSRKYKSVTKSFMRIVQSGDPEGFRTLLSREPWHADTLLQWSEVFRHREDHAEAIDAVDRALFSYERSFIGAFTFTTGLNRLDFDSVENRPFFLALHRQTADLQRRGCLRTAFEFARLLYSLDPWTDPHGALFHIDFLSFKAGMTQWILDVCDLFTSRRAALGDKFDTRLDPSVLPGFMFARALALQMSGTESEKSASALIEAANAFPSVIPLLADKLDLALPASIRGHRDFKIETDASGLSTPIAISHILSHIYVQQSFALWKPHSQWFSSTISAAFISISSSSLPIPEPRNRFLRLYDRPELQYSVYRHLLVLDSNHRRLWTFIPKEITSAKSLSCDPLPPPNPISMYDEFFFEGVDDLITTAIRRDGERTLERLVPDPRFREQLVALFNGNRVLNERFGGNVAAFAQGLAQLNEEELQDMMLALAADHEMEDQGMPGQMPGFEGVLDDAQVEPEARVEEPEEGEESGSDTDDESISPLPIRVLRNVLGLFWGATAPAAESSEEEDEEGVAPNQPVDDV